MQDAEMQKDKGLIKYFRYQNKELQYKLKMLSLKNFK